MSHFTDHQLKLLTSAEGKTLKKVVIYFWVNRFNPDAQVDLIDNVELIFTDDTNLVITCNEESTGIDVIKDFSFEEEKVRLKQEFGDKIKMIPIDASTTKIEAFELSREDEQFLNDALIISFGLEKRSIGISQNDGLIIDYWEDI
jgi:GTP-sensing pleiotropic transcriptional regulator CodY